MRVEDFYASSCEAKALLKEKVHDKNRPMILRGVVKDMCALYMEGKTTDQILSALRPKLNEYDPSWFGFDWQRTVQIEDDLKAVSHFLKWLNNARCIKANIRTGAIGEKALESRADLIVERSDGKLCALIIHFKKADKSPGGKSSHTCSHKDLFALCTKVALEDEYPGIQTALVYLLNEDDKEGDIGEFKVTSTRKSNAFFERWESLYEDGIFQKEYAISLINEVSKNPPPPPCFTCREKYCMTEKVSDVLSVAPAKRVEGEYRMPSFTPSQKQVIEHGKGPMLVLAGPGSGKTAILVGRIERLIKNGVAPEAILAITFTRDAAGELLRRCQSFCRSDEHPEVLTLNALGYKILRSNPGKLGYKVSLLTKTQRLHIIEGLLSDTPKIAGFSYKELKGKNGLLSTLNTHISDYASSPEAYKKKHPDVGGEFYALADDFQSIVSAAGYIGFDEQILLATKLMEDCPEVLDGLSRRYAYVMVDEYQDVDSSQVKFVYSLASHGNLVCVGDDDQAIYGFRGGSNKFMLSFGKDFPNAKKVVLKENFRSTGYLTEAAQSFIKGNKARLEKEVTPVREAGFKPQVVKGRTSANLDTIVGELERSGIKLGEIAVLASKNATLEELSRGVSFPYVLGRAFLKDDPLFRLIYELLDIRAGGMSEGAVYKVLSLMGAELPKGITASDIINRYPQGRTDDTPCGKAMDFMHKCMSFMESNCKPVFLTDFVLGYLKADNTASGVAITSMVEKGHISSLDALYGVMRDMVEFEDDTRTEPDTENAVLFITSHESKGMEWKAVIMADDYRSDGAEETNRLYYVAMTRAKDRLYILTDGSTMLHQIERREVA